MTERHTRQQYAGLATRYLGTRLPVGEPERADDTVSDRGYMYPAHDYTYGLSRTQLRPAGPFPEDPPLKPVVKKARRRIRPVPAVKPEPHTYQVAEPFIPAYEVAESYRHTVSPYDSVANERVAVSRNKRNDYSVATMLGDLLESQ